MVVDFRLWLLVVEHDLNRTRTFRQKHNPEGEYEDLDRSQWAAWWPVGGISAQDGNNLAVFSVL